MSVPSYTLTCSRVHSPAQNTFEFSCPKPSDFSFKPGQFVLFDVPHPDDPTNIQPRAFSIASTPDEQELLFLATLKTTGMREDGTPLYGRASHWISRVLQPGSAVRIQGPFGNFTLSTQDEPRVFIATGSGIAPFRSMIQHALQRGDQSPIDTIFCVRTTADLCWMDEWKKLTDTYPSLRFHTTLTQPDATWIGHTGRVQTVAPKLVPDLATRALYACGNPDMTKDIRRLAVEEWGIPKAHVHVEGYL